MDPLDKQDGSNSQGAGQEDGSNLQGDGHDRSNLQGADLGDNEIGEYLRESMDQAWRNHRHNLHKCHIKGKSWASVRAAPPPPFFNREQWYWFLEYTKSEKFQAASKRNKANRSKLRAPNTLGRRSMAATRHVIAVENEFKSDLEVGRAEVYIRAHTKKDKTIQSVPRSFTLGKDKSGRMRGMGAGVSSTMVKKTALVLKKKEELRCENTTTNSKLDRLETELQMVKDMIVASQMHYSFMNKMRDLHFVGGLKVASGEIVAVNPQSIVHGRPMGEGVFKILLTEVVNSEARVFFPNDFASTLGEVGVHGYVTWPTAFLQVPKDDA
ncbi:hypothetical protein IFM89_037729 [Coptis chinensis]|uniref:Transposase Tnp1/En/Spm-like domain-containing protein n=1 Tax=Coptis chinensis TaxID=261450 RepID=A0A835IU39_9MAGN|nr:hypothetical protein IFM89_037729 [Coptis chinensis]